ncbi:MAG: N-acetylmannosamine-6-phosphate 2-epimerase [Corynebacterium sp.]|uniref:N-acetylmannosamine-6-phosphate 2-epimerase n=1 Tax=Corynebacterium sp. TaxID=1720 RepID=UPI0026E10DCD|nr:N-acetylmannosamine-6-phosphate 2-epimerase [Corynebacterium sp.]MDO5670970.1 N-acetylmannosamine-6-phosphate 2-epimerase [Corynebacterium sp.]
MNASEFLDYIRGSLIVSAQAPDGHVLRDTTAMVFMARAAEAGGSAAIRCGGYGGLDDIRAIAAAVDIPVIGLTKEGSDGVYITPTVESARSVIAAGATVAAIDATHRPRRDGSTFAEQVAAVHAAGGIAMADIATPDEAAAAVTAGADLISTTLAGYTEHRAKTQGPDLELIRQVRKLIREEVFLIGEGRFHTPDDVRAGREAGADAIIVGTAITDPAWITARFAEGSRS